MEIEITREELNHLIGTLPPLQTLQSTNECPNDENVRLLLPLEEEVKCWSPFSRRFVLKPNFIKVELEQPIYIGN